MNNTQNLESINSERIEHALGQIRGLTAALMAIISTHPEASLLLKHLQAAEMGAHRDLPSDTSEHFLRGLNDTLGRLKTAATTAPSVRR